MAGARDAGRESARQVSQIEWVIIAAYFAVILGVGYRAGRGNKTAKDMHLGGRSTPWLAALISVVATEISAATLLGAPQSSFNGALFYVQLMLGSLVARYILAYLFIPAYYDANVVTVYEFLEGRLGPISRHLTSAMFLMGRLVADAARLYMASLTLSTVFEWDLLSAVVLILGTTAAYTMYGGIRAVIWTDVLQGLVFGGGGGVILIGLVHQLAQAGNPLSILLGELLSHDKLKVVNWVGWPELLTDPYSFQTAFFGGLFLTLATHGTDHDMIQRVLTCKDRRDCSRSLLGSGWAAMAVGILFLLVGSALWLGSQHGMFQNVAGQSPILTYLDDYATPLMRGALTAAILAASMSSLGSSLAASTATLTNDLLPKSMVDTLAKNRVVMLMLALTVGTLTVGTAWVAKLHPEWDLLTLALGSLTLVYGTLLAFFMTALFSPARPGRVRCIVASVLGVATGVSLFALSPLAFEWRVVAGMLVAGTVLNLGTSREGARFSQGERPEIATP